MEQHTFLVEIGTEELPPKALRSLGKALAIHIITEFDRACIGYGKVSWFAAPRRLAVKATALDDSKNNGEIKIRGPSISQAFDANGNPTEAAKGWARSCNIAVNTAEHLVTDKGEWLVYRRQVQQRSLQTLLCHIVKCALNKLPIPKMMRWGKGNIQFARPVHTVAMLLDNSVIPGYILGIKGTRTLCGHRFMGERKIKLKHADHYPRVLLIRGRVMADYVHRKETIRQNVEEAAKKLGGVADLSNNILEEVTSLVEWPVVLTAHFEEKFLAVPSEALVYTMKNNQKYFPVYDTIGNLLPHFIFVSNIESKDPQKVISGNEKVVRSRLEDAEFFFNNDRKCRLEDYLPCLDGTLFHKQLGNLRNKSTRIEALASWVAEQIGASVTLTARASQLSKCDLMTSMVCEFTETQGIMGMYYARYDGEEEEVALAQKEQYQPRFSDDELPTTLVSCAVAIAEKIDTLIGLLGIGQYPKGNKDPFALRRAALGVLRIIVEKALPLDLNTLVKKASLLYGTMLTNKAVVNEAISFMLARFPSWYQKKGYNISTIQAVLECRPTRPADFDARVRAVSLFRTSKEAVALALVNKRILNILAKSNEKVQINFQTSILKNPAEIALATRFLVINERLKPMFEAGLYQDALIELASLREPLDTFFDSVMVMTTDYHLRVNRLALLAQFRRLCLQVADISLL